MANFHSISFFLSWITMESFSFSLVALKLSHLKNACLFDSLLYIHNPKKYLKLKLQVVPLQFIYAFFHNGVS